MLSKILSKENCAQCRFCCSFRRGSLWETPVLYDGDIAYKYDLTDWYETDDPNEEVPCPYLVEGKGCSLRDETKPFECKLWPLRVMDKEGETVIALATSCPEINKVGIGKVTELVNSELREKTLAYAKTHPEIIKKYRDGYTVIEEQVLSIKNYKEKYMDINIEKFKSLFNTSPEYVFTAPGRTELSGNHTDHQHGCVLAAAVDLECKAWVAENALGKIRIYSEGMAEFEFSAGDIEYKKEEVNTSIALVRGIAFKINELGYKVGGFDAYITSTVLKGSGLSSSAAFEVLIVNIMNKLFCGEKFNPVQIAQIGQWSEYNYFGKPNGLMDETASSVGGVITIDFRDPSAPVIEKLEVDLKKYGYGLCIIDTGADHADLTDEYAAVPKELAEVCKVFDKKYLRDVNEEEFYERISQVRAAAGDRGVLRAIHVFEENKRVAQQVKALKESDFDTYLKLANESGESSYMLLQNVIPSGAVRHQNIAFALALSKKLLNGRGATRIQGGGFAGTIQAFVPLDMIDGYKAGIEKVLGEGSCQVLNIRQEGGTCEMIG